MPQKEADLLQDDYIDQYPGQSWDLLGTVMRLWSHSSRSRKHMQSMHSKEVLQLPYCVHQQAMTGIFVSRPESSISLTVIEPSITGNSFS